MITDEMAQEMMRQMKTLKIKVAQKNSLSNRENLKHYEAKCLDTLQYFVHMKAAKYRNFANYEDLVQEGLDALLKAIRTFKPETNASFFFWAGLFVNTRLVRSANNHSAIRFPMHIAKQFKPHKENTFPEQLDVLNSPERNVENQEIKHLIEIASGFLTSEQKELVSLVYGERTMSISSVCRLKKISRSYCVKTLSRALEILKENIQL